MNKYGIKTYPYRWIVLAVYFLITVIIEIHWLTFASLSTAAQEFYQTTSLRIDFLSMIYMIVFIIASIPASYIIDTWGLKKGLYIGAILTGFFAIMKAWRVESLLMVTIAQTGLALAQPFFLNSLTKVGAKWFPVQERATVAGLGTLAQYIGIIIALAVTPLLVRQLNDGVYQIADMMWIYGYISLAGAMLVLIFIREEPPTPPASEEFIQRTGPIKGIREILTNRDMVLLLVIFFFGLGIFNAVSTCIDQICANLTMDQTGMVGGVMLLGGVLGALILPPLSDKKQKRKPFLVVCLLLMLPGLAGLLFFKEFIPMMISAFVFGFFIMSAGPIGFQYGAEKSYPAPESTSQGIILLVGQVSGIIFVFALNKTGVLTAMISFILFTVISVFLSSRLKESMSKFL
ncbi:MAG: MFS transporter [Prolixibacteraceae bacterium]|nr:MFS transporter [Prolixibacteraceae bacterium]